MFKRGPKGRDPASFYQAAFISDIISCWMRRCWQECHGNPPLVLRVAHYSLNTRDQEKTEKGGSSLAKLAPAKNQRMMVALKKICHSTQRFDMIAFTCFQLRTGWIDNQSLKWHSKWHLCTVVVAIWNSSRFMMPLLQQSGNIKHWGKQLIL